MNIESSFEADAQLAEAGKPGMRALDNPTMPPQPLLAFNADTGDAGSHTSMLQTAPASAAVVSLVGMQIVGPLARASIQPTNRRDGGQDGFERHRILPVRAGHRDRQWNTLGVYDKVSLAAELAPVRWVRAGFLAPRGAGHACPVGAGPAPVDLVVLAQAAERRHMQLVPCTGCLPVVQPSLAGHAAAEAKFLRGTGLQHKQDAVQRRAVVDWAAASAFGRRHEFRYQRFKLRPQFLADFSSRHAAHDTAYFGACPVALATLSPSRARPAERIRGGRIAKAASCEIASNHRMTDCGRTRPSSLPSELSVSPTTPTTPPARL